MAIQSIEIKKRWEQHCINIQNATSVSSAETKAEKAKRIEILRKDYAKFVEYYFPHFCTDSDTGKVTPCAKFHIDAAKKIISNKNQKQVFKWARGHAKSTHMDIMIPMWLKCQRKHEINVMVLVGKSETNANILLSDIQAELQYNQRYIADFGIQYNYGHWEEGSFVTKDDCAFFALGRGQSPRGLRYREKRPDYIVIDDLDDDELCENPSRVTKLFNWVKEALFGSFGALGGRFIMIGNLISKNSVLQKISQIKNVEVSQVNAYDKNGEPSWKEYYTKEILEDRRVFMGYFSFEKEYMNNPITEGNVFKNEWIHWKKLLPLNQYDDIVGYIDPAWTGSVKSCFKAVKIWGKKDTELHNIRNFVRHCSFSEMVCWLYDFHESLPETVRKTIRYYMEASFMQYLILDEFTKEGKIRGYQLPIAGDRSPKENKYLRIEAISPLWERGFVYYNEALKEDPDTKVANEQLLAFSKGTSSAVDAPDADEGAINLLQKRARTMGFTPRIGQRPTSKNIW